MRKRPRPICPKCGTVDVSVDAKKAICNRCGFSKPKARFFEYPQGGGGSGRVDPVFDPAEGKTVRSKHYLDKAWKGKL